MDEQEKAVNEGLSLNNLASVLFQGASILWYAAAGIEIVIGMASAFVLFLDVGDEAGAILAIVGSVGYVTAYAMRLFAESKYGHAETLRRQAALSEALAWPVSAVQISAWRQRSGKWALDQLASFERAEDYYATSADVSPVRLSHMTSESAFYTRQLYGALSKVFWIATVIAVAVSLVALSVAFWAGDRSATLSAVILSILTVVISTDIMGWAIRLTGMQDDILEIEQDFERMGEAGDHNVAYVMRLVGEYNCIVVGGIPILKWWFNRHHSQIRKEWDNYLKGRGGLT